MRGKWLRIGFGAAIAAVFGGLLSEWGHAGPRGPAGRVRRLDIAAAVAPAAPAPAAPAPAGGVIREL